MMSRPLMFTACLLGFVGVAAGAFGAHLLEETFSAEAIEWWRTGTFYLLVHVVAALALSANSYIPKAAGWCLTMGAGLFAATLYALALGAPSVMGAVTPIGGLLMLGGWGIAAFSALTAQRVED